MRLHSNFQTEMYLCSQGELPPELERFYAHSSKLSCNKYAWKPSNWYCKPGYKLVLQVAAQLRQSTGNQSHPSNPCTLFFFKVILLLQCSKFLSWLVLSRETYYTLQQSMQTHAGDKWEWYISAMGHSYFPFLSAVNICRSENTK